MIILRRFLALFVLLACTSVSATEKVAVVATFSILGDFVRTVGGDRVTVHTLVGANSDAHVYQPTPADARALARAKLVVVNGLGFEGWIDRLIRSSGYRGRILVASEQIKVLKSSQTHTHGDHAHDVDPHAWQDLANALRYVDNIERALSEVAPDGQLAFKTNAERYKREIVALDAEIRKVLARIPAAQRKVVTSHNAFGYFGRAYGITFIAAMKSNAEAEASPGHVARLIQQIRRERISAVFVENISDPRLLERIRLESNARIGGTLYSDSLSGEGGPAPSFLAMMRHNARMITDALTAD